jgi:drug/metabolite transporter (DMT)-like permease
VGYGLIAAVKWGLSAVAAAKAARRTGTYLAVLCGQGLGVLSLLALAAAVRPSFAAVDGAVALRLAVAGLVGLVGYLCYYRAIEDGPVGLGSAISSTYGGIAALLAVIVLGERLGAIGIAGVVLAVAGVAMAIARAAGPAAPPPAAGPAAAGLLAFARGGQVGQVAVTAAVSSVYPVIPLAAGLALFGERLRASQLLGVGLVVAGLVLLGLTA